MRRSLAVAAFIVMFGVSSIAAADGLSQPPSLTPPSPVASEERAARKWNERNVTVAPTLVNGAPGVTLGLRF